MIEDIADFNVNEGTESRNWVFTLNNYTPEEEAHIKACKYKYIVYGYEVGKKEGTPHLQGYVEFKSSKKFSAVKKCIGRRARLASRRGTAVQASTYCKKDGNFFESGEMSQPPDGSNMKRRWEDALLAAKEGRNDDIPADIYFRYVGNVKKIRMDHLQRNVVTLEDIDNEWIYGPPGCGKSYTARQENPVYYSRLLTKAWWNDYNGQEVVIIDDFGPRLAAQSDELKQLADSYPLYVEYKGGVMLIRPRKVIVTSNYLPEEIWTDPVLIEAIRRRFKFRQVFSNPKFIHRPVESDENQEI